MKSKMRRRAHTEEINKLGKQLKTEKAKLVSF